MPATGNCEAMSRAIRHRRGANMRLLPRSLNPSPFPFPAPAFKARSPLKLKHSRLLRARIVTSKVKQANQASECATRRDDLNAPHKTRWSMRESKASQGETVAAYIVKPHQQSNSYARLARSGESIECQSFPCLATQRSGLTPLLGLERPGGGAGGVGFPRLRAPCWVLPRHTIRPQSAHTKKIKVVA